MLRQMGCQEGKSDRREAVYSLKVIGKGEVLNLKIIDKLVYDLDETRTDYMRYYQKEKSI
jgi:hypothetical protein